MKTITKIMLILTSISYISGCFGPGIADYDGQFIDGYGLSRSSANNISLYGINDINVPAKIIELGWDESYIVIKREFLDDAGNPLDTFCWYIINLSLSESINDENIDATLKDIGINEIKMYAPNELRNSLY